jgi:hypothetical protein
VVTRWPEAVGPAIARNAWPARIARDGTLHVSTTDSVWAFELGHNAAEIAVRLGVTSIRFAPGPIPRHEAEPVTAPPLRPTPEQEREAATLAARIEHEEVRRTVQKAALFGLARAAEDRPL